MVTLRKVRYALVLTIVFMALFVTVENSMVTKVWAGNLSVNPTHAGTGQDVGISGSLGSTATTAVITSCTISGSSNVIASAGGSCVITSHTLVAPFTATFNGSFTVGNVPQGQYLITVSGGGDTAQATLTVDTTPIIQIKPAKGPVGTSVQISGAHFQPADTSCTISSPSSNSIAPQSAGCSTFSFTNSSGGVLGENVTGSFVVGNVPTGQFVVQVTGSSGDFAQAVFNVTRSSFIQLSGINGGFVKVGQVASGPTGLHVSVEGTNFLETDTTCTLSSPSGGNVIAPGTQACSFFDAGTGFRNVTGSFVVGNIQEGQYVIQVTGNAGDFAQAVFNVTRGAFIQLGTNGVFSPLGKVASGPTGTHVSIEGSQFLPNDALNGATCSLSSISGGNVIAPGTQACSFFKAPNGFVNVTGSFVVGNVVEGQYVIQVSGSAGDSAQAVFNVTAGAFIQLGTNGVFSPLGKVASGPTGTHVSIEGSQFLPNDALNGATCSVSSPTGGTVVLNGGACSFFKAPNGFVNVTGSFVVGNVQEGQYVIQVSGSAGDTAQAVFNVTAGAFIQLGTNGVFSPRGKVASGPIGIHVDVEGSQFLPGDALNGATCSLSSSGGAIVQNGGCAFFKSTTPPFNGFVNVTGSFVVGNVPEGQYVITVSGTAGDSAQAVFNVTAGAFIQLSGINGGFVKVGQVASGPTGTHVSVKGSQFLPNDAFNSATCSLSSPSGGGIVQNGACSFFKAPNGFVNVTGSFVVGNVPEGQYVIQVSGSAGDSAQAVFNVTRGPFIQLGHNGVFVGIGIVLSGPSGEEVQIEGTFFQSGDTAGCTVSSPGSPTFIVGAACSFFKAPNGFVNVTGSFIAGPVAPGQYVVQVTGSTGDFAQAVFNVTRGPTITLRPNFGFPGNNINVTGSGFSAADTSCVLVSGSSNTNNPINPSSGGVAIRTAGSGNLNGSFLIAGVPPGQYVIQVTCNTGDFAQAVLIVKALAPTLELFPTNATNGATVTFQAGGLSTSDTSCILKAGTEGRLTLVGTVFVLVPDHKFTPNTVVLTNPTCSIISPSIATGSFVVGPFATEDKNWTIVVRGITAADIENDNASATFNVTASVNVTPSTGTINSVFTFTGSGFESIATSCTATIVPPFPTAPTLTCQISSGIGQVSGSVVVPVSAFPGTYGIRVLDNTGSSSTGFFTVGTPSAWVTLNPSLAGQSQQVGLVGGGFNPNDTYCTITAGTTSTPTSMLPWIGPDGAEPVCSISGGFVSGSFRVSDIATGGYYLITVTGFSNIGHALNATRGDFAQNFLGVVLDTTVTTFSSTTTSSTSTTSRTTTTTSMATSYSYSSSTVSTTGILYTTYFHGTYTTVYASSTTTASLTTTTTQTQTTVTVTTTTAITTGCGALPCPYAVGSFALGSQKLNLGFFPDSVGLLAALALIIPMLLRRLFS